MDLRFSLASCKYLFVLLSTLACFSETLYAKHIAIIGGSGEVGRVLLRAWCQRADLQLTVIDAVEPSIPCERLSFVKGNAADQGFFSTHPAMACEKFDAIVNLAGVPIRPVGDLPAFALRQEGPLTDSHVYERMRTIYQDLHVNVLRFAAERRALGEDVSVVHASSIHACGGIRDEGEQEQYSVSTCRPPDSLYGVLKVAAENIGEIFNKEHDVKAINLRLGRIRDGEDFTTITGFERRVYLSNTDTVRLFDAALTTETRKATVFGLSINANSPFLVSTPDAIGFMAQDDCT